MKEVHILKAFMERKSCKKKQEKRKKKNLIKMLEKKNKNLRNK